MEGWLAREMVVSGLSAPGSESKIKKGGCGVEKQETLVSTQFLDISYIDF